MKQEKQAELYHAGPSRPHGKARASGHVTADKSEVCISGEKHGAGVENNSGQEGSRLKESMFGEKREGSGVTAEMKWGQ